MDKEQVTLWADRPAKIEPPECVSDLLLSGPKNGEIQSTICKCYDHVRDHSKIMCSISGGYDSDIMLDLMIRCGGKDRGTFVFYNTGLEYDATKEHISFLEDRYGMKIICLEPKKAIPVCCREYGAPFWSKYVSDMICRLQRHGFRWEDKPLEVLLEQYPNCKSALRWWCNGWGEKSKFNIDHNPAMKEFIMKYPPQWRISAMCCEKSKKEPANLFERTGGFDLLVTGVRKSEGGKRSTTYKSCFDTKPFSADRYRPLFWWTDREKELYRKHYGIIRSDCYEVWGMSRTGCAGCPFGRDFEEELELVKVFEPKRYKAMCAVFGQSYDYTRRFLEFREKLKAEAKPEDENQTEIEGVR